MSLEEVTFAVTAINYIWNFGLGLGMIYVIRKLDKIDAQAIKSTNNPRVNELKDMIKNEKERLTMGGGPTSEMYIEQWEHELKSLEGKDA